MSTTHEATINGHRVTLELSAECGEARSECYIVKGRYSASLEAARTGKLTDERGNETDISETDVDAIDTWALANGY